MGVILTEDDFVPQGQESAPMGGVILNESDFMPNDLPGGAATAFGLGFSQGGSLGLSDELGASVASGMGGVFPKLAELLGLPHEQRITYDEALQGIRGIHKVSEQAHPIASGAGKVSGAVPVSFSVPSIAAGAKGAAVLPALAVEGGLWGGAYGFGEGEGGIRERALNAAQSALVAEVAAPVVGGTLIGAGKGLSWLGKQIRPATTIDQAIADLKITGAQIGKAERVKGEGSFDDTLLAMKKKGLFQEKGDNSAGALAERNQEFVNSLHDEVTDLIAAADAKQKDVIIPQLKHSKRYIQENAQEAPQLTAQLQKRIDILENGFKDPKSGEVLVEPWDMTVSGLNRQKKQLYKIGYKDNTESRGLDRALARDIKETVEIGADFAGKGVGSRVKDLNRQIGQHLDLEDILERAALKERAGELGGSKQSFSQLMDLTSTRNMAKAGAAASLFAQNPAPFFGMVASGLARDAATSVPARRAYATLAESAGAAIGGAARSVPAITGDLASSDTDQEEVPRSRKLGQLKSKSTSPDSLASSAEKQAPRSYQDGLGQLLDAVKHVESRGNTKAVSPVGAKGPYQLMDATGKEYHDKLGIKAAYDPFDETQSRQIAAAILQDYYQMFGDWNLAVQAYHTGPGNIRKGKIGPEGKAYPGKVMAALEQLMGGMA